MTQSEEGGLVPVDSFRVRLAIVRALMGWNYEEAQEATGINAESWRLWEKGARNCSTKTEVAAVIAQVTPYSKQWIAFGGPLRTAGTEPPTTSLRPTRTGVGAPSATARTSCPRRCLFPRRPPERYGPGHQLSGVPMRRAVLLAVLLLLALAGCGSDDAGKTSDLRHYLAFNYAHKAGEGDSYSGLGTVTYKNGDVTIDAPSWNDNNYGAYLYCSWVEPWLADNGTDNSRITVRMGGSVVLQTHNMGESCEDASYNAEYGG